MVDNNEVIAEMNRARNHSCVKSVERFGNEIDVVLSKKPQKGCMPNIINKYEIVTMSSKAEWFTLSVEKEFQNPE